MNRRTHIAASSPARGAAGFSLIELLVVVAIIAILMGILAVALGGSREKSREVVCATQLSQIGKAAIAYAADNRSYLPVAADAALDSGTEVWRGTASTPEYAFYGRLLKGPGGQGYLQDKAEMFLCPNQDQESRNASKAFFDADGEPRWGLSGNDCDGDFTQRSPKQEAPTKASQAGQKTLAADVFTPNLKNHSDNINVLRGDMSSSNLSAPENYDTSQLSVFWKEADAGKLN